MDYFNVLVKTDFAFKIYVDFEFNHEGSAGQLSKFSLRKGDHHFRVESSNPLVFFEETLSLEYDRIIQLSFIDLIQRVSPSIEDSLWIEPATDFDGSEKEGLLDVISGNWILPPRYQNGQLLVLEESKTQARFVVVENGTLFFLSNSGRVLEKKHYHHIDLSNSCGKYIIVSSAADNEKCGLIYVGSGVIKELTQQEYDEINESYCGNDLFFNVRKGNRWGLINNQGEIVLPVEYAAQIVFNYEDDQNNSYAFLWNVEKEERHLINSSFTAISIPDYQYYHHHRYSGSKKQILQNNLMLFSSNNKYGLFDIKRKKTIVDAKYEDIDIFGNNDKSQYLRVMNNKKWGFVNSEGKEVIAPIYDETTAFHGEYAAVCCNREWWVIDEFGNRISESVCGDSIMPFESYDRNARDIQEYDSHERNEAEISGRSLPEITEYPWDHMYIIKNDISKTVGLINLKNGTVLNSNYYEISYKDLGLFFARGTATSPRWNYCIDESCQEVFPGFSACSIKEGKPFMVCRFYAKSFEACEINGEKFYKIADSNPLDIPNRAGYADFALKAKVGFFFQNRREIPTTEYDDAEDFIGDFAIVSKYYYSSPERDADCYILKGLINLEGEEVIPIKNLEIERLHCSDLFRITKYDGANVVYWVHQDKCFEVDFDSIGEIFYEKVPYPSPESKSDLLKVHYPDGYNLVDEKAVPVFSIHYDNISYICPHRYAVEKNKKHGVLSETGETIIPLHYDFLEFKSENWIIVSQACQTPISQPSRELSASRHIGFQFQITYSRDVRPAFSARRQKKTRHSCSSNASC